MALSSKLPVNKKTLSAAAFILTALLTSAVAGTLFVKLGKANPYKWAGQVPPDADTKPPTITIFSPENNTVYAANNLTISFNVRLPYSPTASHPKINTVYYKASWQNDDVIVYKWSSNELSNPYDDDPELTEFSHKLNLAGIPEGSHNITIYATEYGIYWNSSTGWGPFGYNTFSITGSSSIGFTIDTTPEPTLPEFSSFLILPSFIMATLVAGLIFKKKIIKGGEA